LTGIDRIGSVLESGDFLLVLTLIIILECHSIQEQEHDQE
jgi:hypothetical protein